MKKGNKNRKKYIVLWRKGSRQCGKVAVWGKVGREVPIEEGDI